MSDIHSGKASVYGDQDHFMDALNVSIKSPVNNLGGID